MGISYLVDLAAGRDWLDLVSEFRRGLEARLGPRLRRVIAKSSPDDLVYDSNVFVFVDRVDPEVLRAVASAALEVQERTGEEGLNPMTVEEGEIELRQG